MKKEGLDRTDKSKAVQDNSSFFIIIASLLLLHYFKFLH